MLNIDCTTFVCAAAHLIHTSFPLARDEYLREYLCPFLKAGSFHSFEAFCNQPKNQMKWTRQPFEYRSKTLLLDMWIFHWKCCDCSCVCVCVPANKWFSNNELEPNFIIVNSKSCRLLCVFSVFDVCFHKIVGMYERKRNGTYFWG